MFTVNTFKAGKWTGYICEATKAQAICAAKVMFNSRQHDAVNVESAGGKVEFVAK